MKTTIEKNIKVIVIVSAVAAILLGGLLLLIADGDTSESENGAKDLVTDIGGSEDLETKATTQPTTEKREASKQEKLSAQAAELFAAKTDTIGDGVAIAKMMETIGLEQSVARYAIELQEKQTPKIIKITFEKTVKEDDRIELDEEIQGYAMIILALVADVDEVQWSYQSKAEGKAAEPVTVYLKSDDATKLLNGDIKEYGRSEAAIQKLLESI